MPFVELSEPACDLKNGTQNQNVLSEQIQAHSQMLQFEVQISSKIVNLALPVMKIQPSSWKSGVYTETTVRPERDSAVEELPEKNGAFDLRQQS